MLSTVLRMKYRRGFFYFEECEYLTFRIMKERQFVCKVFAYVRALNLDMIEGIMH